MKDTIVTQRTSDPVLLTLLEIVVTSVAEERPLFNNPLEEPPFYRRYFRRWVKEGLEEAAKIAQLQDPEANSAPREG